MPEEAELIRRFRPYTMTGDLRSWILLKAIEYIDSSRIVGDIVECGVWRGGNIMMAKQHRIGSAIQRRLFMFDTFAGMAAPTQHDVGFDGRVAETIHQARKRGDHNAWAYASLKEVLQKFDRYGLLKDDVVFRQGMVEDTLREGELPERIALLRLDTDWYLSTKVELEVLYPRLSVGGVLIIDDYGTWSGARKAVDEYFDGTPPLLIPIDHGCRLAIKV